MKLNITKPAVVITPSIGSKKLETCAFSVASQTYKNLEHLIVFDGHNDNDPRLPGGVKYLTLPYNTGATGGAFYGHRIYAAFAHLVNADYVFFCDEDNWFHPDHVANAIEVFEKKMQVQIVHSLREIYTPSGELICEDNCESLGAHEAYTGRKLADTSSLAFKRNFLAQTASLWHSGWGGDAKYLNAVTQNWTAPIIMGTGKYSLCYRLDGNPNSVTQEFFNVGNAEMQKKYGEDYPWRKSPIS